MTHASRQEGETQTHGMASEGWTIRPRHQKPAMMTRLGRHSEPLMHEASCLRLGLGCWGSLVDVGADIICTLIHSLAYTHLFVHIPSHMHGCILPDLHTCIDTHMHRSLCIKAPLCACSHVWGWQGVMVFFPACSSRLQCLTSSFWAWRGGGFSVKASLKDRRH